MKKHILLFGILLAAFLSSYSQYNIAGRVKTSSGTPIANVRVTLFNSDTTIFVEKRTNANGIYIIRNIVAGSYTIGVAPQ